MDEIAELFISEFSDILNAIIGAAYISSNGNFRKTSKLANQIIWPFSSANKFPYD
jgi:hypothetical protein